MLNTNLKTKAKNYFEKDFFKLISNDVFRKTMENIRIWVDIQLVTDANKVLKLIRKPNLKKSIIINENSLSIEMEETSLELNKPIYVGFTILDLSKYLMYEFHNDVMLKKYKNKLKLCYQDTDSLIYKVQTKDIYKNVSQIRE